MTEIKTKPPNVKPPPHTPPPSEATMAPHGNAHKDNAFVRGMHSQAADASPASAHLRSPAGAVVNTSMPASGMPRHMDAQTVHRHLAVALQTQSFFVGAERRMQQTVDAALKNAEEKRVSGESTPRWPLPQSFAKISFGQRFAEITFLEDFLPRVGLKMPEPAPRDKRAHPVPTSALGTYVFDGLGLISQSRGADGLHFERSVHFGREKATSVTLRQSGAQLLCDLAGLGLDRPLPIALSYDSGNQLWRGAAQHGKNSDSAAIVELRFDEAGKLVHGNLGVRTDPKEDQSRLFLEVHWSPNGGAGFSHFVSFAPNLHSPVEGTPAQAAPSEKIWREPIAFSMRGTSHEKTNTPCQDAHAACTLRNGAMVVAVADGAGSAKQSHRGSRCAVDAATGYLRTLVSLPTTPEAWKPVLRQAMQHAIDAVRRLSIDEKIAFKELSSTLILSVTCQDRVVVAQVGDGGVVTRHANGGVNLVVQPEKGGDGIANVTCFLTHPDAVNHIHADMSAPGVTGFAAFSDGLEHVGIEHKSQTAAPKFWSPMIEAAAHPEASADYFRDFLLKLGIQDKTDDDITLVMATPLPRA